MLACGGKGCFAPSLTALLLFAYIIKYKAILIFFIRHRSISHAIPCRPSRQHEATLRLKCNGKFTLLRFPVQPRRKFFTVN